LVFLDSAVAARRQRLRFPGELAALHRQVDGRTSLSKRKLRHPVKTVTVNLSVQIDCLHYTD
jgi:hypothetical protein